MYEVEITYVALWRRVERVCCSGKKYGCSTRLSEMKTQNHILLHTHHSYTYTSLKVAITIPKFARPQLPLTRNIPSLFMFLQFISNYTKYFLDICPNIPFRFHRILSHPQYIRP
jgi:hypothetical protein